MVLVKTFGLKVTFRCGLGGRVESGDNGVAVGRSGVFSVVGILLAMASWLRSLFGRSMNVAVASEMMQGCLSSHPPQRLRTHLISGFGYRLAMWELCGVSVVIP